MNAFHAMISNKQTEARLISKILVFMLIVMRKNLKTQIFFFISILKISEVKINKRILNNFIFKK